MKKLGLHTLSIWFGGIMILLVISGAIALTFTDMMNDRLFGSKRTAFIFILLAYGIYRSFRLYQIIKSLRQHEENN